MSKLPADPRLDGLFDLAMRDGVDIRPTLLRVLTDLYVQKPFHTREEETQYVELATGLIDAVDSATLAVVAARLRDYPATPEAVRRKLSARDSAPAREDLCELFFSASAEERRLILINLVPDRTARPLHVSPETLARLEASALQRNPSEFTRILRALLNIAPQLALRIVQDASGEPLVVACKSLGMAPAALQRILLFLNPAIGHSVDRVYQLAQLFDELSPEAAAHMLSIWRGSAPRKRSYTPANIDDETRSARSFASPSPRRMSRGGATPLRKGDRA